MDTSTDVLEILRFGKITIKGQFLWGSNYTFLVQVQHAGATLPAVYKPSRGERMLWDFPVASLASREVAAFIVSEAIGWGLVPPTAFRPNGPLGEGSVQLFVDHDPDYHYFNFDEEDRQRLRPVVLFDIVINNADRKGSHVLRGLDGRLWLIDHGICFHVEEKLRTVIWDFIGQSIPDELVQDLTHFGHKLKPQNEVSSPLTDDLLMFLHTEELIAMEKRVEKLVESKHFPSPDPHRRAIPWPQI